MSEQVAIAAVAAEITRRLEGLSRLEAGPVRALRRQVSEEIGNTSPRQVIELAVALVGADVPGSRWIAYELILHHGAALASLRAADLKRLGEGMSSWGEVDAFACYVAGRAWRDGTISSRTIVSWARSPDRWWRRAALVSTVPLNVKAQGGSGDAGRTMAVCALLVEDRDPMVVKAMSWALRALAVRDPNAVRTFLREHEAGLASLVKREVRNKLETGRKAGRQKDSSAIRSAGGQAGRTPLEQMDGMRG